MSIDAIPASDLSVAELRARRDRRAQEQAEEDALIAEKVREDAPNSLNTVRQILFELPDDILDNDDMVDCLSEIKSRIKSIMDADSIDWDDLKNKNEFS